MAETPFAPLPSGHSGRMEEGMDLGYLQVQVKEGSPEKNTGPEVKDWGFRALLLTSPRPPFGRRSCPESLKVLLA